MGRIVVPFARFVLAPCGRLIRGLAKGVGRIVVRGKTQGVVQGDGRGDGRRVFRVDGRGVGGVGYSGFVLL